MLPLLSGLPAFRCLAGGIPNHHFRCADAESGLCVLRQQMCNGMHECPDQSDERSCTGTVSQRPCTTILGEVCTFPFTYNGFRYDRCTGVDADEAWRSVGVGRCQSGYLPALASDGISLRSCQDACSHTQGCAFISFTESDGGFCSGYTSACEHALLTNGQSGYHTYGFNSQGGAWCPTRVSPTGNFLGVEWSGPCGTGCVAPLPINDPMRSACSGGVANSNGGPAHCAPSPPPPSRRPPPPMPPPSAPPPAEPPAVPPPWLALNTIFTLSQDDLDVAMAAAGIMLAACLCLCWACMRQRRLQARHHEYGQARRAHSNFRHISTDELEALAGPLRRAGADRPPHRVSRLQHHGRGSRTGLQSNV